MDPPRNARVLIAMSGGVDSSVAAALLQSQGYEVMGITMCVIPGAAYVEQARQTASSLGIPLHVADLHDRFEREVIADFVREYSRARTPNPCVRCNLAIKFGALLEQADLLDVPFLATGHYARREVLAGREALRRAAYRAKDQSYVLAGLSQAQLARAVFPLGGLSKEETRHQARGLGLAAADQPESQEICFVPDDDYRGFLAQRMPPPEPGPIVSTTGEVLGKHQGLPHYTIGQRRGLGIAAPRPYYVVRLDAARNEVVVGHEEETYCAGLRTLDVHWCSIAPPAGPFDCLAQVRYLHQPVPATVTPAGAGIEVRFHEPQRGVAPGQWLALYDEADYALAGAIIDAAFQ